MTFRVYDRVSICGSVCMRYRSSETNYQCGYRHKCTNGCLLTANKVGGGGGSFFFLT